jgi:DNA (cytosine-5)-methyltransferase 1
MVNYTQENDIISFNEPQLEFIFPSEIDHIKKLTPKTETLNVLSLFSGCGGMDLGFEGGFTVHNSSVNELLNHDFIEQKYKNGFVKLKNTKFKTIFANDILSDARNAWINYFQKRGNTHGQYYQESIVDLVKMHKNGIEIFPKNIDIVTGGFPCQDFSIAGRRNGFNSQKNHRGETINVTNASIETRGQLYMWMKEVIEITKPKIFIAENVKGLVNLSNVKEIIQNDFSSVNENGYIVLTPKVLQAADYGVPQSRERVIFIGIKKSALKKEVLNELMKENISPRFDPYPKPTHNYSSNNSFLKEFVKLNEIFENLDEPHLSKDVSQQYYSKAKFMGKHCQGQTEIKLNNVAPTIRSEHHGNIEFRRLSATNGGKNEKELFLGMPERRLTVRECALIQTFPPDYEFVIKKGSGKEGKFLVSPSQAYKIIGNAVPPLLAYHLAKRLENIWEIYFK